MSSKFYSKDDPVSIVKLTEYSPESAREALRSVLSPIGGLDCIKPGSKVVIKANLVSAMKPDTAATTHPVLLCALCDMLIEHGCSVVIGDSPGGLYNAAYLNVVYNATGVREAEKHGAKLNSDFSQHSAEFAEAKVLHTFTYTGYLDDSDYVINFCKVKSHGMMGMSCAVKNMFGAVPGVIKPEYHYRFPKYEDFANVMVDLNEYFHPVLSIADGVVGMEGNGPTAGTPREIGCVLASRSPHCLDLCAADMLGFSMEELPILVAAYERDMIPAKAEELTVFGDLDGSRISDFERVVERRPLEFSGNSKGIMGILGKIAAWILRTRPVLKKDLCVGCGICANICPAKAIVIKNKKAVIDRKACIRCFCCQEFCPKSAMKVHRTAISKLFHHEKKK